MMWYGWGHGEWTSWVVGTLMMLVFWGGLIAFAVWAIRGSGRGPQEKGAEEILKERFARGEIDADEFASRRKALRDESAA